MLLSLSSVAAQGIVTPGELRSPPLPPPGGYSLAPLLYKSWRANTQHGAEGRVHSRIPFLCLGEPCSRPYPGKTPKSTADGALQRAPVSSQELPKAPFQWDQTPEHGPALRVNGHKTGVLSQTSSFSRDCFGRKGWVSPWLSGPLPPPPLPQLGAVSVPPAGRRTLTAFPTWSSTPSGGKSSTPFLTRGENPPSTSGGRVYPLETGWGWARIFSRKSGVGLGVK